MEDRRTRNTEWQRDDKGQFIVDEQRRGIRLPGEPLNAVADFSKIPDWVASGPETHFMVQDRDAEMVRFFWGVSGYAELEVLEENVPGREDPNNPAPAKAGSLRFEELPAPPEMEDLRAMLLSPPEYERPKVFYLYDPRPHEFLGPQLGLPWRE